MRVGILALLSAAMLCVGASHASAQAVSIPVTGTAHLIAVLHQDVTPTGNGFKYHEVAFSMIDLNVGGTLVSIPLLMELKGNWDETYCGPVLATTYTGIDANGNLTGRGGNAEGMRRQVAPDTWQTEWHYVFSLPSGWIFQLRELATMHDLNGYTSTIEGRVLIPVRQDL